MLDLVGNPEDRFSHDGAHFIVAFNILSFEGWIWVLIASVPDFCILFTLQYRSHGHLPWHFSFRVFLIRLLNISIAVFQFICGNNSGRASFLILSWFLGLVLCLETYIRGLSNKL